MPRQPRLDAPGPLHYVMGRGIVDTKIFRRERIGRISFLNLEGGGEDEISGRGGGPVSGGNDIGGNLS